MPQINIRWADNTNELKARLKEGIGVIDAMKASVDKTAAALGGQGLFKAANNLTAAIVQLGGATKLTASEQDRANALLTKAIEKYTLMGQVAPAAMRQIQAETSKTANGLAFMEQHTVGATDFMKKYAVAAEPAAAITGQFGSVASLASTALGTLGIGLSVGAVVGFAKGIANDADELIKLKDKTDLSVGALKELRRVGNDSSVSLESMSNSAVMLQRKLAVGSDSTVAALSQLGLKFDDVIKMSSEDKWFAITKAMQGVTDQTKLIGIGSELMGRNFAEILPAIKQGFGEVNHGADAATAAIDDLGDKVISLWQSTKDYITLGFGGELIKIKGQADQLTASLEALTFQAGKLPTLPKAPVGPTLHGQLNIAHGAADIAQPVDATGQANAERVLADALKESTDARKKAAEAAQQWADVMAELNTAGRNYQATLEGIDGETVSAIKFYLQAGVSQATLEKAYGLTAVQVKAVASALQDEADALKIVIPLWNKVLEGVPAASASLATFHQGLIDFKTTLTSKGLGGGLNSIVPGQFATSMTKELRPGLTAGFSDLFKTSIPAAITSAFQGGGSPVKAVGSLIGSQLGTNLVTKVGGTITGLLGKTVGGAVNAILPGIGSLIGPGLNALIGGIKKLFGGPSAEELAGRKTSADFQATLANMLTAQQKLEAGGVGWKMSVIAVRDAYLATGRTAAEAEAATAKLFDTKNPNAYKAAIEEINGVLDEQKQDAADLQTAIQKYGFSLEQLGPVLQKQKLDEQAKTLINDWRLLVGAGIDIKTVNDKMASSVNDYLQTAKRTGTEIPAAFKPVLQSMIDQGTLIDENGNKITDLNEAGLTFSETMTQGFDRVVAALNRVLVGLGLVPEALAAIPDNKTIDVNVNYNDAGFNPGIQPDQSGGGVDTNTGLAASMGGRVTRFGLQHLRSGGIVQGLRVPQFLGVGGWAGMQTLFQPRGTDTVPAMLTPGETVRTVPQEQALSNALSGNSSAILAELKAINDNLARTRQTIVQIENKEIARATIRAWNDGTDGLLTQAKEALGVD